MRTARRDSVQVREAPHVVPQPTDSDRSVVFRGDGEPKTPQSMLRDLVEFEAQVGLQADTFSLGGTVQRLEERFAGMLGKEQAVFMPTGTLANHLALRKHCGTKLRAVVQEQSHLYHDTGDCLTALSGINLVPLAKGRPCFTLDELKEAVDQSERGRVLTPIGAVQVESPVRRQAGQIVPFDLMAAIADFCRERGIPTHLDGARLYMMSAAMGVEPQRYAALFDTVYVSLYKYFGAPFGAILAGGSEFIADLYHARRTFGSGLPSACFAAALALKGTEGFEQRFAAAMGRAEALFARLNTLADIRVGRFEHGSNIFPMELAASVDAERLISNLRRRWVFVHPYEFDQTRVFLTVNITILRQSVDDIVRAFEGALAESQRPPA